MEDKDITLPKHTPLTDEQRKQLHGWIVELKTQKLAEDLEHLEKCLKLWN